MRGEPLLHLLLSFLFTPAPDAPPKTINDYRPKRGCLDGYCLHISEISTFVLARVSLVPFFDRWHVYPVLHPWEDTPPTQSTPTDCPAN